MSDRLAVMAGGKVEQVGSPAQVYEEPSTAYVADFLGAANVVDVDVVGPVDGNGTAFRLDGALLHSTGPRHEPGPAKLVVRPERLVLDPPDGDGGASGDDGGNCLAAVIERVVYRGASAEVILRTAAGTRLTALLSAAESGSRRAGDDVKVRLPAPATRLLPPGGSD
jgi:spermidine/putrescine transport system ATP-binding protein